MMSSSITEQINVTKTMKDYVQILRCIFFLQKWKIRQHMSIEDD